MLYALFFHPFDKREFDGMLAADVLTLSLVYIQSTLKEFLHRGAFVEDF